MPVRGAHRCKYTRILEIGNWTHPNQHTRTQRSKYKKTCLNNTNCLSVTGRTARVYIGKPSLLLINLRLNPPHAPSSYIPASIRWYLPSLPLTHVHIHVRVTVCTAPPCPPHTHACPVIMPMPRSRLPGGRGGLSQRSNSSASPEPRICTRRRR